MNSHRQTGSAADSATVVNETKAQKQTSHNDRYRQPWLLNYEKMPKWVSIISTHRLSLSSIYWKFSLCEKMRSASTVLPRDAQSAV